jgi:hypothetical protein
MDNSFSFPESNIDPRKKDKSYILKYVKAAYNTSRGNMPSSLYFGSKDMDTIRAYAQGAQSTDRYKQVLLTDENAEESWQSVKWDIVPILPKFREIAVARIYQQGIDVQANAVDDLSKSEEDKYFNKNKVKILMREVAEQMGSELADSPVLKPGQGEPEDMEQLEIEKEFGYKHVMAAEAELAIELSHGNSNFTENDKLVVENLIDFGIGGLTQWIDENGTVKERSIDVQRLILSYCTKKDFSDLVYWGEVQEVSLTDLAPYFSRSEMETLCNKAKGQWGNPFNYDVTKDRYWERFKVYVIDFKFLDWNTTAYEDRLDDAENERFGKTKFNKVARTYVNSDGYLEEENTVSVAEMNKASTTLAEPKYMASTEKVMYKAKWIIDSDFVYDFGLSENMVRKPSCWWDTGLDIQLYAWNFEKMKFKGLTERLMPLADDVQLTWYKIQNLKNKLMPYILNMDLDSFEGIAFGKGGANMKPYEVVDFLFSNYIALYRSRDKFTNNPNYKPVTVESTGAEMFVRQFKEDMFSTIDMMRQVSGLNEITDGSAPNPKNLNSTNEAAALGTNNALWPIYNARKSIVLRSAENIVLKQQIAVKLGKVSGMVKALGTDTLKMYQINPEIANRELGIFVEDAPTEEQRQQLWMDVNAKETAGLLDVSDKIMVMSTRNLKMAAMVLSYRIRKRKEAQQQFEMQKIQEANQGNQQVAMMSEQMKQQTIQVQLQADLQRIEAQMRWEYQIQSMSKQVDYNAQEVQANARTIGQQIQADAKIVATHITAEGSKEKQHIANAKPKKKP